MDTVLEADGICEECLLAEQIARQKLDRSFLISTCAEEKMQMLFVISEGATLIPTTNHLLHEEALH